MFITFANKITFIRILNVPLFIGLLLYYKHSVARGMPNELFRYLAIFVFFVTITLDAIDGYIARKRNEVTHLGSVLDPIADKSLMISSIILLTSNSISNSHFHLPVWFVILVISRDIVLVAGALLIHFIIGTIHVKVRLTGKAATFFQTAVIIIVLCKIEGIIFVACILVAAFFTCLSGVKYMVDGYRQMEKGHEGSHKTDTRSMSRKAA